MSHPWYPNWRGRKQYWENTRWTRTPEHEVAIGLFRRKNEHGWHNYWCLLFRRLGEDQIHYVPVCTQSYLTTPTGSNQTTNGGVDATWNNANNKIEVIAGGASGDSEQRGNSIAYGGGGGEHGATTNFNIANPGTTTFVWQIGAGGTASAGAVGSAVYTVGKNGGDTWWNGTTQLLATVGAIHGAASTGAGASPGSGGAGGTGGVGTTHNAGGRGGNTTAAITQSATGGGGAGGPNGVGGNGGDTASGSVPTAGGQGDATSGGAGGAGSTTTPGHAGTAGTELGDSVHGCGGGGGAVRLAANSAATAGSGGLYGAGGGGCSNNGSGGGGSTVATSGAGTQGIIVLTWTPAAAAFVNWGFNTDQETRIALRKPRKQTVDRTLVGEQGNNSPFQMWRNAGWEVQPPPLHAATVNKRAPGIKGKSEFAYSNIWPNAGWEPTRSQEPRRRWERAAGLMPVEPGIEAPFIPTVAAAAPAWGFDIQQQPTIPHWKREAAIIPGWHNIETPFQFWLNRGFEEVVSQEPRQRWERRGAHLRGIDGTEFSYSFWNNFGWGLQEQQPPHRWYRGHGLRGDDGTGAPFINWINRGFEEVLSQEPRRRWERAAATMRGDDGSENPFQQWYNFGWEPTWAQPKHPLFRTPDIGDTGIEFPFIPPGVIPLGSWAFDIQQQPTIPRWKRYGAIVPEWRDGIEFPFQQWLNFGWEQVTSQPLHRIFRSPDIGDTGTEAPFIFTPAGFVAWPFDPTLSQDMRRRWERAGAIARGDDGTKFPFSQWRNLGWEQIYAQPPHRIWKSPDIGDTGIESPYIMWRNTGWEVQPWQPPHKWYRGQGLRGDDGTNAAFVNWLNWGWEQSRSQEPRRRWEKIAAFLRGPDGTDARLSPWFNWGWEQATSQPRHKFWKSPDIGDSGIEAQFIQWLNFGWEVQPPQPPRWPQTRRGGILPIEPGIEFPFIFIAPIVVSSGWEIQSWQPPAFLRPRRGALLRGDDGTYRTLVNWFNAGWEVQPWQPPRRPWERRGAILRGDEGIYRQLIRWFNAGWEIQPPQPPRWPRTRRGVIMPWEQGIEFPYKYVQFVNQLGEVNLPILRRWPKTQRGAILRGDDGFYHPFIPSIVPTPGVRPRRLTGKVFIIDAVPSMIDRPLYFFGPNPKVNESCTLVFYVGGGLPVIPAPVLFTFTRPDGVIQNGDVPFAFIGTPTVTQIMIPNFPSGQYLVYQFGIGELSQSGTWKVSAITTDFFSLTYSFTVLPF